MKLAILETGRPPGDLVHRFGDYPAMFGRLLGPGFEVESFDVQAGHVPEPQAHAAYLLTGSPAGVYDPLPWIEPLLEFIRAADRAKMVGICFGHQVMAQALGGHVEKSEKGWGTGLHRYRVDRVEPWMDSVAEIAEPASHQDQVVLQPPNTGITLSSDFTPYAGLAWTDRPAISFQFHPEFTPEFAKALIAERHDRVSDPAGAIASLGAPNDSERVGGWIRRFLEA
ncbi:type 1 glutamine amidotransferase [Sphingomonas hankyongi]|uniref:Type 1 glutamine amidotransferase n=1 Tax=Sphingomonas hankyongi TaxID=2908209 RepID=A0ABT0RZ78_9SPHN|nr:type 1 glutamine amidotransferase [Sphingomonas hankyongi]MCL6728771.1 type 1 glutamine amidotransferase [Sphingomonas hankyongi]